MAGFSFIHAADLHIDSPLLGLGRYEGAPVDEIRVASRKAFENLVRLAEEEAVAFVVLAGDVFDGDWRDYNTGVFLNRELSRLGQRGIRVYLVQGNHDAQGTMTRTLRLPDNSRVFTHDSPETVLFEEHRVALHGQSFSEQKITQNLATAYPAPMRGYFNIGVLHTALEGRQGHARYAPCSLSDLAARGYAYWALGHVHKREEVSREPWVVFPGNIQGRNIRETGAKGCSVVTVRDGAVAAVRHAPLDVVRWASVEHDVTGLEAPEEVVDRLAELVADEVARADGRLVAARVTARGVASSGAMQAEPPRWRAELVSRVASLVGPKAWIEKVLFDARPAARTSTAPPSVETVESLAVLEGLLAELVRSPAPGAALADFALALQAKLGGDAPQDEDSPFSPDAIDRARADAALLLRYRLHRPRGGGA